MIENSTVFVLGAGASWHYGYPTGDELVKRVIEMAERFSSYCKRRVNYGEVSQAIPEYVEQKIDPPRGAHEITEAWNTVDRECRLLMRRLHAVSPVLIDHFLAWNASLRPIGRLMIAAVILECEAGKGYRQPWYRFIVHKLVYGCGKSGDLLENDIHFITFNYDASLEYHLYEALISLDIIDKADAHHFLSDDRIIHTYGCVHSKIPTIKDFVDVSVARALGGDTLTKPLILSRDLEPRKLFLDRCLSASLNLKTIDPHDKEKDEASLVRARQWIENAGVVYILGYGFDANNNRRIGLSSAIGKVVMFTNFGDRNTINKRASKLLTSTLDNFSSLTPIGDPTRSYYEKSIRNVYEAFEKDFEPLEGELTGSTKI
jgi:hypothetical protein